MQTLNLRALYANKVKVIPAILVAPGLAVAKALERKWVKDTWQIHQIFAWYWVYHVPSGLPISGIEMTEHQALSLAQTFADWLEVDWTKSSDILGLDKDLKERVQNELKYRGLT